MKNIYKKVKGTKIRTGFSTKEYIDKDKIVKDLKNKYKWLRDSMCQAYKNNVSESAEYFSVRSASVAEIIAFIEEGKYE